MNEEKRSFTELEKKSITDAYACHLFQNQAQEMPLMASNHNKEANMSIMNHHFAVLGFEGLLNVNAAISIKKAPFEDRVRQLSLSLTPCVF